MTAPYGEPPWESDPVLLAHMLGEDVHFAEAVVQERFRSSVRQEARRLDAVEAAGAAFGGFSGLPLDEALEHKPEENPWLVRDLMRTGHKVGLTAAFKVGKTTVLGNLARSLVDGEPFLDRFEVAEIDGTVAIFDFELTTADALDMYERLDVARPDRVFVESLRGTGFTLANDVHAEQAVRFLRSRGARVWMLDPFARAMQGFGSEYDNNDVAGFLARVDRVAAEAGLIGVVIPAHTGRVVAEVGTERARGATKFDDDMDARWIYTRDSAGRRFFRAEGRNGIGHFSEFAVDFDPATDRLRANGMDRKTIAQHKNAEAAWRVVSEWTPAEGADDARPSRRQVYDAMPNKDDKTNKVGVDAALALGWLVEDSEGKGRRSLLAVGAESPARRKLRPVRADEAAS